MWSLDDAPEMASPSRFSTRTYPLEWGEPQGAPLSEERAAWVLVHVRDKNPAVRLSGALARILIEQKR